MKKTEIDHYTTMDKAIVVTGFRNVATREQLEKEIGKEGLRLYLQEAHYYEDSKNVTEGHITYNKAVIRVCAKEKAHHTLPHLIKTIEAENATQEKYLIKAIEIMREAGKRIGYIRAYLDGAKANQTTTVI